MVVSSLPKASKTDLFGLHRLLRVVRTGLHYVDESSKARVLGEAFLVAGINLLHDHPDFKSAEHIVK